MTTEFVTMTALVVGLVVGLFAVVLPGVEAATDSLSNMIHNSSALTLNVETAPDAKHIRVDGTIINR